jgi:hypothetical protein
MSNEKLLPKIISYDEAMTASMFIDLHGKNRDDFWQDVCKIARALLLVYHDQQDAEPEGHG